MYSNVMTSYLPLPLASFSGSFTIFLIFCIMTNISDSSNSWSRHGYNNYNQDHLNQEPVTMKLTGKERCTFTNRWIGTWFQSGIPQPITFNQTWISSKGICIEADGDKFILYSQIDECYRCVVFHEKHINVLQYKETFCYADPNRLSLQNLCRQIPGDAGLYSMFRLDSSSIPCPFQGSFTFSYSRGRGICHTPVSTINTCITASRLVLNYQACYDVRGSESRVEELECLASWKDGSTRYLVGLMNYDHPHDPSSYEERFRCFAYERGDRLKTLSTNPTVSRVPQISTVGSLLRRPLSNFTSEETDTSRHLPDEVKFYVAQSGDGTCNGLSAFEGSRTLTLRQAPPVSLHPCIFPSWTQVHTQWFSLDAKRIYTFENSTLRIFKVSDIDSSQELDLLTSATCVKCIPHPPNVVNTDIGTHTFLLRSISDCQIGFVCLRMVQRDTHILELQLGRPSRHLETACHSYYSDGGTLESMDYVTLLAPTPEIRQCPFLGSFDVIHIGGNGEDPRCSQQEVKGLVSMGCSNGLEMIQLNMYCSNAKKLYEEYKCNGWWVEATGQMFLVATSITTNERLCFRIHESNRILSSQELFNPTEASDYTGDNTEENLDRRKAQTDYAEKTVTFIQNAMTCSRHDYQKLTLPSMLFNTTGIRNCDVENAGAIQKWTFLESAVLGGLNLLLILNSRLP